MNSSHFSEKDIASMDKRKRAAFVNSLSGFKSASLIGTINAKGETNLAIFSSVVHIGSSPALVGIISRPDVTSRHTLENILETNCFSINHINAGIYRKAHQTSARYPRGISEFEVVGLSAEFHSLISAPYVKESRIKYGLNFAEKQELKINGTVLIIGKVVEVFAPEGCVLYDGFIDLEKAETLALSGLDSYHSVRRLARLSYAKPDSFAEDIL